MQKVFPVTESGCWLWTAAIDKRTDYGWFSMGVGKQTQAHRAAYEIFKGRIPDGMHVLHSCDVRSCVNPNHLRCGDHVENMGDRRIRNRTSRGPKHVVTLKPQIGVKHWNDKLTEDQVREIRASDMSQSALSRKYGVSVQQVHRIVHGQAWTHLEQ